jgi:hypothetical protein
MKNQNKTPPSLLADVRSEDDPSYSLGSPYIEELRFLPINIANGGFTVVIPGHERWTGRLFIYLVGDDGHQCPIPIKDAYIQVNHDCLISFTSTEIDNHFKVGDVIHIIMCRFFEREWYLAEASIPYTVVN